MTRASVVKAVAGLVAAGAVATGIVLTTSSSGPLTGTIDKTYSKGECQAGHRCWYCDQAVDLDLVRINVDTSASSIDALALGPGCTGRIGLIEIQTQAADGVKVIGAHDLVIGGGIVTATGRFATSHLDCMQALAGSRVTFVGVKFACQAANNAQWFITQVPGAASPVPSDIVCDGCEFHPGASYHSVTIGPSLRSGARNSLVCPGLSQGLQWKVLATAQSPVDVNNAKPWPASADARCVTSGPPVTTPGTTTAATTTAPATTAATSSAAATTTTTAPQTAAELIASGFVLLRGQATLYASWKAANPGEAAKLDTYLANGGTPPVLVTATGRTLVRFAQAGFVP